MAGRHLLLVRVIEPGEEPPGARQGSVLSTVSLGRLAEIEAQLSVLNCAGDGSASSMNVLHGPGITLQLPMVDRDDPVMQIMASMNDETIAWPVLERICRVLGWKMMDPRTGRVFGG